MPRDDDFAPVIGILGMRGHGKSTELNQEIEHDPRVVGWDPMVTPRRPDGQLRLAHRFWDADECAEWIRANRSPRILNAAIHSYDPDDFAVIADACIDSGPLTLAIDEAQTLCPDGRATEWFAFMLACGRHFGIKVVWTARRAAEVARICTSQSEALRVFKTVEDADLKAIRSRFGKARTAGIANLPRFEFDSTEEE